MSVPFKALLSEEPQKEANRALFLRTLSRSRTTEAGCGTSGARGQSAGRKQPRPGDRPYSLIETARRESRPSGRRLAQRRGVPFFELDHEVERECADHGRSDFLRLHGQPGYQRFKRQSLHVGVERNSQAVVEDRQWSRRRIQRGSTFSGTLSLTVWVARHEQHMRRVVDQGDLRPIARGGRRCAS